MQSKRINNARIGIALGSGSARGWAHIGVLRALADLGIEPEIICGSSIGALGGAAYASNQLDEMESMVTAFDWKEAIRYLDLSIRGGGFIQGERLQNLFNQHVKELNIESLPRRFAAVATDLETGREVWLQSGNLLEAVRASAALPGLLTPFAYKDGWLVDGGIVDPVPVSLCRAMGADIVIAVSLNNDIVGKHIRRNQSPSPLKPVQSQDTDAISLWDRLSNRLEQSLQEKKNELLMSLFGDSQQTPGLLEVISSSINIMQDRITRSRMAGDPPDILLSPKLSHLGLLEFDQGAIAIAEGRACVERMHSELDHVIGLSELS